MNKLMKNVHTNKAGDAASLLEAVRELTAEERQDLLRMLLERDGMAAARTLVS